MAKVFSEDAYCLGLIYSYIYGGNKMVSLNDLKKFHDEIEYNLKNTKILNMYSTIWYDNEESIYFNAEDRHGEVYCVLYPNIDINKAKKKYMSCLSVETLLASIKENALDCIGLERKENVIKKKTLK